MLIKEERKAAKRAGLYAIVNLVNQKVYIGRTRNVWDRYLEHGRALERGAHANSHLQSSYAKYGKDNFEFIPLFYALDEDLLMKWETRYMSLFASTHPLFGYNAIFSSLGMSSEKMKEIFHDPEWYKNWYQRTIVEGKASQAGAAGLKKRLQEDPEFARQHSETTTKNLLERWQDPEQREKGLAHLQNVCGNEKHNIAVKKAANSPEGKASRSETMRRLSQDPEFIRRREEGRKKRGPMSEETKRKISSAKRNKYRFTT